MHARMSFYKIDYYKKEVFYGSFCGMRFSLGKKEAEEKLFLEAVIWPEPLSATCTDESLKTRKDFEFSDKGIDDAVEWLDEQYEADKARWNGSINDWNI